MATEYDTEGGNKQLGLSLRVERTETCDVFLHAPYWIINKTGLPLQIRVSVTRINGKTVPVLNPSAWGHLNPSSYCDVGRLFYGVFKLWSKLQRKK